MRLEIRAKGVLELLASLLAGLPASIVLLNQRHQATQRRLRSKQACAARQQVRREIADLHARLDTLREAEWTDLLELQRRQLDLLQWMVARGSPREHVPGTAERIRLPRRTLAARADVAERLAAG